MEMQSNLRSLGDVDKTQTQAQTAVDVMSEKQIPVADGLVRSQQE